MNCNKIAKKYNVNRKTISDIKNHKTWKLLTQNIDFPDAINKSIGENNSSAKLTTKQVLEIKDKYKLGIKLKDLAIEYNVKYITIYNIIKGISWKNTIEYSNDKKVV